MTSSTVFAIRVGDELIASMPIDGLATRLNSADDFEHLDQENLAAVCPQARSGPPAPPFVGLVTTTGCRMACTYCDFASGAGQPVMMPPSTAAAAIDHGAELMVAAGRDELEMHLFGGEPFDAWRTVRTAVERTRFAAQRHGVVPRFEATTAGCYGRDRAQWIGANLHRVVLSVDGSPSIHDQTRPRASGEPSSRVVFQAAEALSDATCDLVLRMCLTAESAIRVIDSVAWLLERFRPSTICLEPVRAAPEAPGPRPPTPTVFLRSFAEAKQVCDNHHVELVFSGADLTRCDVSPCPVARDGYIVHPDGTVAACYLPAARWRDAGLELSWARVDRDRRLEVDWLRLKAVRRLVAEADHGCRGCFCRWHCAGGCRVSRPAGSRRPTRDPWCMTARVVSAWLLADRLGIDASGFFDRPEVEAWPMAEEAG